MGLCAVILGCATTDERFGGARKMLDYGFANYAVYTPEVDASSLIPVRVLRGVEKEVAPTADAPQPQLIKRGRKKTWSVRPNCPRIWRPRPQGAGDRPDCDEAGWGRGSLLRHPGGGGRGEDDLRPGFFHPAVGAAGVIF